MGIPDHVINLETLKTPYPYTKDGKRRWEAFTDWPDPWVMIGAIALVTTRLHFVTTVYLPAMRDPYSAAKSIGTAAYLAGGRLELGIGVGWCEEEFTLMGQRFDRRGKRTDEMLDLMKALWEPGWTEFEGEFYSAPRLEMEPTPPHIPIYVGGLSDIALRRAARNDGWIGDLITTDRAIERVGRLRELRVENGIVDGRFHRSDAADRRIHPRALRACRGERHHRHHHYAVDVLHRPAGFACREDRRHAQVPQGPGARLTDSEHAILPRMAFTVVLTPRKFGTRPYSRRIRRASRQTTRGIIAADAGADLRHNRFGAVVGRLAVAQPPLVERIDAIVGCVNGAQHIFAVGGPGQCRGVVLRSASHLASRLALLPTAR